MLVFSGGMFHFVVQLSVIHSFPFKLIFRDILFKYIWTNLKFSDERLHFAVQLSTHSSLFKWVFRDILLK